MVLIKLENRENKNMAGRLDGKIAIITGATSGIGEATAEVFVTEGAKVVVAGRSEKRGKQIAKRLGENAIFAQCDVTQEDQIKSLVDTTVDKFGRVDTLFNNAGGGYSAGFEAVTKESIDELTTLLFTSVVLATKHVLPIMKQQQGGCIINNSSISALRTRNGSPIYAAIKAAVTHYSRIAGHELGPYGIRVNAISPGAIATPIFWGGSARADDLEAAENEQKMEKLKKNLAHAVPLQRTGLAQDIAFGALYLASDEACFVTCHDLVIDGGRTAMFMEPPRDGSGWKLD